MEEVLAAWREGRRRAHADGADPARACNAYIERLNAAQEGTMSSVTRTPAATHHVVMLSFEGEDQAGAMLRRVRVDAALDGCEITADAVVSRDSAGHIHVHERGAAGIGAAFSAVTAGLFGFLPDPILLPIRVVVSAVAGGVAGHFAGQVLPSADEARSYPSSLAEVGSAG